MLMNHWGPRKCFETLERDEVSFALYLFIFSSRSPASYGLRLIVAMLGYPY